jgi:hypothetical protein
VLAARHYDFKAVTAGRLHRLQPQERAALFAAQGSDDLDRLEPTSGSSSFSNRRKSMPALAPFAGEDCPWSSVRPSSCGRTPSVHGMHDFHDLAADAVDHEPEHAVNRYDWTMGVRSRFHFAENELLSAKVSSCFLDSIVSSRNAPAGGALPGRGRSTIR